MKIEELISRVKSGALDFPHPQDAARAKTSFLLNLFTIMDLTVPVEALERAVAENKDDVTKRLAILLDALSHRKKDIPDRKIRDAHRAMSFPWSRAVMSCCLYGKDDKAVTTTLQGVPPGYDEKEMGEEA